MTHDEYWQEQEEAFYSKINPFDGVFDELDFYVAPLNENMVLSFKTEVNYDG